MQNDKDRELRLIEAVESCRPRSDDLGDPDFAFLRDELANDAEIQALYRRVQETDGRIADAFQAVPVPDGLAGRIVDRLAAARSAASAETEEVRPTEAASDEAVSVAGTIQKRWSRRWVLGGAGALATAAAVLVAVLLVVPGRRPVAGTVRQEAVDRFEQDVDGFGTGKRIEEPAPGFPPSRDVRLPRARWRWVEDFLGNRAVAYEAHLPGGSRATLYVLRAAVTGLPPAPPSRPDGSGSPTVVAWTSDDLAYVLVFEGGPRMYELLVPQGPIT
jgi:hypothetical protein